MGDQLTEVIVIGLRGSYPLFKGPEEMHLVTEPSLEDPLSDQPSQPQSVQERPGSSTSFPPFPEFAKQQSRIRTKTRPVCRHFSSGKCNYGYQCSFRHPEMSASSQRDLSPSGDACGSSTYDRFMCHFIEMGVVSTAMAVGMHTMRLLGTQLKQNR